jgi:hypothetical protein
LRRGQHKQARAAAGEVVKSIERLDEITSAILVEGFDGAAVTLLALIEQQRSHEPALNRKAARLCKSLRKFARTYPIGWPLALLRSGTLHWLGGKHSKAEGLWRRCLISAEQLSMPYTKALAHYELGRVKDRQLVRDHLEQALALFDQTAASADILRAQQHLATLQD